MFTLAELQVVERRVSAFDTVSLDPDGRIDYSEGELTAVFEADAETETFRVALFNYGESDALEIPEGAVILGVGNGVATALVPTEAYHGESAA